jgi:hypothetical protein
MIALSGYSRFPIFYSSNGRKRLGFQSGSDKFNVYIEGLKGDFVAIHSLKDIRFRRRFVLERKAYNPELKKKNIVPQYIYAYPDTEQVETFSNIMGMGFYLEGARKKIFVPLLSLKILSKQEVNAFLNIAEIKDYGLSEIGGFMDDLGIEHRSRVLANDNIVFDIQDPMVSGNYQALISPNGKVLDVDFCIHGYENYYITELVMFTRESGSVYHLSGFNY